MLNPYPVFVDLRSHPPSKKKKNAIFAEGVTFSKIIFELSVVSTFYKVSGKLWECSGSEKNFWVMRIIFFTHWLPFKSAEESKIS